MILAQARKRDALSLWHLLSRVDEPQRLIVYDRLRTIAPPPAGVTKEGILRLEQPMLDEWWNALSFDNISVWRQWERSWAGDHTSLAKKAVKNLSVLSLSRFLPEYFIAKSFAAPVNTALANPVF